MQHISTFPQMIEHLRQNSSRKRVAVVCPYDDETVSAAAMAIDQGLADIILIGDSRLSEQRLPESLSSSAQVETVIVSDADEAAAMAVKMVKDNQADILMKGLINTDTLLKAILNKENGLLPKGKLLTHLSAAQLPGYGKLLFFPM